LNDKATGKIPKKNNFGDLADLGITKTQGSAQPPNGPRPAPTAERAVSASLLI
jgi:hypothetical protein